MAEHKPRQRPTVIVRREYTGSRSAVDALVPVLLDDLRRKLEPPRTLDSGGDMR
jgi:hypothetical protein